MSLFEWLFILALLLLAIALIGANKSRWLAVLAVLAAVVIYAPNAAPRIRAWNVFHYYLNAKYFQELGYEDLYPCALWIADERDELKFGPYVRDLHSYRFMPQEEMYWCPYQAFTAQRWQAFGDDMAWIMARPGPYTTMNEIILLDKGYNMLPTWTAIAEPLANAAPPGSVQFWAILYVDLLAIGAGLVLVWRSRGLEVASVLAIFMITYLGTYRILDANWLQYLWLGAVLAGLSAWYMDRRGIAGALLVMAVALRIFPVFLFVWPALHARTAGKRFWTGAGTAALGWGVLGMFTSRGLYAWQEFFGKMLAHSSHLVIEPLNMGLRNLLVMLTNWDLAQAHLRFNQTAAGGIPQLDYFLTPWWAWFIFAGVALMVILPALYQREPAFHYGLGVMFALVVLSRYYYQILATMAFSGNKNHMRALLAMNLILAAVGASYRVLGYVILAYLLAAVIVLNFAVYDLIWRPYAKAGDGDVDHDISDDVGLHRQT